MTELKPCPFCGGEARIHASHHGDTHYYQVECGNEYDCGAWPAVRVRHTEAEAVEAWNTRHVETCRNLDEHNLSCLDMEPIVRCRDCLYVSYDGVLSTGWCNENCREVRPFDFCSFGERRDDEAN